MNVPEGSLRQVHHVNALPLVEKYFELVGIFEDGWQSPHASKLFMTYLLVDSSYVQSSQDSEVEADGGVRKQLRLYYVSQKSDESIRYTWSEIVSIVDGTERTGFSWL